MFFKQILVDEFDESHEMGEWDNWLNWGQVRSGVEHCCAIFLCYLDFIQFEKFDIGFEIQWEH